MHWKWSPKAFGKRTERTWNQKKHQDRADIVETNLKTEKSPGNLRRLVIRFL